jgi:hypothetical protein
MTAATSLTAAPDLEADSYVVIGVAVCFLKDEEGVHEVTILEPIPAAALASLLGGVATSYKQAFGTHLGAILAGDLPQRLAVFPSDAQFCSDFSERAIAAARTYKRDVQAASAIPLGTSFTEFNHSTERKRLLNIAPVVRTEDNVKQHAYTHQVL